MKNAVILALTIIIGFGVTYLIDQGQIGLLSKAGTSVPDFSFMDEDKTTHTIKNFAGKVVVLNFWASWCPPCIKEMPDFFKLAQNYPDDVVFIGLSSDVSAEVMNKFIVRMRKKYGLEEKNENLIFALDKNGAVTNSIFQIYKLPETIIIDKYGVMREKLIGADWNYDDLETMIERHL